MEYSIGELAARFGLATHVLRHWEDEGLLSPARRVAGRRVYGTAQVARVADILLGKEAGFRLAQARERIARLTLAQTLLEHGLRCQHEDYQSCPRHQEMVLARLRGVPTTEAIAHH